jgi:gluconokinase
MIVIVMGVAGAGKTTVGRALARDLGWTFIDADDFHPLVNVEKMRHGEPLEEDDRAPWLEAIGRLIAGKEGKGESAVVACSSLRAAYRAKLTVKARHVLWVYLRAEPATIRARLAARRGHFAGESLVESQFATLEAPHQALALDAAQPVEEIVAQVLAALRSHDSQPMAGVPT